MTETTREIQRLQEDEETEMIEALRAPRVRPEYIAQLLEMRWRCTEALSRNGIENS